MIFDQEYMKLCSEKTLQTNKEGFFLQFAEGVAENVGPQWVKHVYGKLGTDRERLRKIYEDKKVHRNVIEFLTNVQEIYRKKCGQTAKKRLLEAEEALKSGDKKKTLILYSQSILKAPKTDVLSVALLGRAKLLISLNEYNSALSDIQLSLKEKLSSNHKFEAFWMLAICYKALKEDNKAQISLNLAEKLIGENQKLLETLRHSMQLKYEPIETRVKNIPPISSERHASFTVKNSNESGNYIIATEEIKTGEILVVEEPEVACLLPEKFGTHCHHCFDRFLAPIGCPDCSSVAFCGPKCRDEAVGTYHKYECRFLDLLIGSGMSVLSLAALRAVTQKGLEQCLQLYKNKDEDKLFRLCTNSDKRSAEDFLQRTLMAAFLLRCLQKSGYFNKSGNEVVPTEEEYQIGEMLLRYLQTLQFNAHEIYETLYNTEHRIKSGRPANIGVAVYPTVALFNHECYPAVSRYFVGRSIVITSIRPVVPNDPIAENYGPIFTCRKLIDRQRSLSARYWFNCRCSPCFEDWPMINDTNAIKRVRCPTLNCTYLFNLPIASPGAPKCPKCQESVVLTENTEILTWCEEQYEVASKLIESKEIKKAIGVLCEALQVFHRVSGPPHRETHLAEEALRVCFADFGNTCDCLIPNKTKTD